MHHLAHAFYACIPADLQTYCVLTAEIARRALAHFGLTSHLEPCQLWCVTSQANYAVGFLGRGARSHKWDGHVVCRVGPWLLDTALFHFEREFSLPVPRVALVRSFAVPTQALARATVGPDRDVWWLRPPGDAPTTPPVEPEALITQHAQRLVERLLAIDPLMRP
ncbi:hypothetical protein [Inhella gelatinilytica]|uniref:Protein kinase domain-containing protein n=1 Tax=Inhella gelatinilytica TaxID=2795030 RepID=A0A931IYZ9_9BURK|nr:hypothetical protein [Inhella gelatinilytica]MBH9553694.1 hypothetical protein [Inhella gelatinilytica]